MGDRSFQLDRVREVYQLSPKIILCVEEVPSAYSASMGFFIGVGGRHEAPGFEGTAHLCEHLFFKGSSRRSAYELSRISERLGGELNAYTDRELTSFYSESPVEQLGEMLDLTLEMLLDFQFSSADFENEKEVVIQELLSYADNPDDVFADLSVEVPWARHPLSLRVGGTAEQVRSLTEEKVRDFIEECYLSAPWVVSVASSMKPTEVRELVERSLQQARSHRLSRYLDVQKEIPKQGASPVLKDSLGERSETFYFDTEQFQLSLTYPGVSILDPKEMAFSGLSSMLGEGSSSWLYKELREERGLVYHVGTDELSFSDCGAFQISWSCNESKLLESVRACKSVLRGFKERLSESEVTFVRDSIRGATQMSFDGIHNRMESMGRQQLLMNKVYSMSETLAELKKVHFDAIHSLALLFEKEPCFFLLGPLKAEAAAQKLNEIRHIWKES